MAVSGNAAVFRYEVDDTIVLHCDHSLIGRVERTYHAIGSHEPIGDELVIAHVPINTKALEEFIESGRPPKGYVFVAFADEECGHSLVREEDVWILNRSFVIGDTVKQKSNDAMAGTIVDVQNSYVLQPICRLDGPARPPAQSTAAGLVFSERRPNIFRTVNSEVHQFSGEMKLEPNRSFVPEAELKRAEDFEIGDHILSHDWVGIAEDTDVDVAVLLENNTVVWVEKPWELELVVPNFDKPLVSLPDFDDVRRPDIFATHHNGLTSIPPRKVCRGQFVITNKKNMQGGRWLVGGYDSRCPPQGRVLDVRTRRLDVLWLCPNAFVHSEHAHMPPASIRPYENLSSFRKPRDIRRSKDIALYDHSKLVHQSTENENVSRLSTGSIYHPGDQVKFRRITTNPRCEGQGSDSDNERLIIPREKSFDFDMNESKIMFGMQRVSVLWQDGSTTQSKSTDLTPISLPEADLCPGDLVTAKAGMRMLSDDGAETRAIDFNEMGFFENDYTLAPQKVGVIQSVDAIERLARVRWFENPKVQLSEYAQVLRACNFGSIGPTVEDVSLYEIMSHPALVRKRRDMVIVAPIYSPRILQNSHIHPISSRILNLSPDIWMGAQPGPTTLSHLRSKVGWHHRFVLLYLEQLARPFANSTVKTPHRGITYDWVGEIVDIGLDGLLTVRFGGLKDCVDVRIPQDNILLIIDENEYTESVEESEYDDRSSLNSDYISENMSDFESETASAIDETVEYEGGHRMDDASGDEEWMTDEDVPESSSTATPKDTEMADTNEIPVPGPSSQADIGSKQSTEHPVSFNTTSFKSSPLGMYTDSDPPKGFAVLEQIPPHDQYCHTEVPTNASSFLKRIYREHRILASSLPKGEVYVRTYESRLDLLRCLIVGPADTPYEHAPFVIDLHLGPKFPKEAPTAHFHSWTSGLGRINPNLYEEGKICLSLLGTWPGQKPEEGWSDRATILQLLVSLQGLVFVKQPFYNEAGFETYGEDKVYSLESQQYSEKAYVMARGFLKHALLSPMSGLEEVLAWLYLPVAKQFKDAVAPPELLKTLINRSKAVMQSSRLLKDSPTTKVDLLIDGEGQSSDSTRTFLRPLSQGALVMLRRTVLTLEEILREYTATTGVLVATSQNSVTKE